MTTLTIIPGDCRDVLVTLASDSVDCVVTSPPYWGLRDYGVEGQIGLEPTMQGYLETMVGICRELRRVLKPTGTFWLNIGDSYAGSWGAQSREHVGKHAPNVSALSANQIKAAQKRTRTGSIARTPGLKNKDLCMIPNRLAILLQEDGWFVRSEIIWHKPNPMPESVRDRPTCAHEKVWLLTKSAKYFYDADAIREMPSAAMIQQVEDGYHGSDTKDYEAAGAQSASGTKARIIENARKRIDKQSGHGRRHAGFNGRWDALSEQEQKALGANARNVWSVPPKPFKGAHFATMPPNIVERCIRAGCPEGGHVFDPFGGSGTTGDVAKRLGRNATLIELNRAYCDMTTKRLGIPSVTADDPDWPF